MNKQEYKHIFKNCMVMTNKQCDGDSVWLIKKQNIDTTKKIYKNIYRVIDLYGTPIVRNLKSFGLESEQTPLRAIDSDSVENITMDTYLKMAYKLKQYKTVFNKKTLEIHPI